MFSNPRMMSVQNMKFLVASWLPWLLPVGVHYEPTHDVAAYLRYMEKEGSAITVGDRPRQGNRSDFQAFFQTIAQAEEPDELSIALSDPGTWARSHNAVRRLIQLKSAHKNRHKVREMDVVWIYGPSGWGKTTAAIKAFEDRGLRWCIGSVGDPPWFDFLTGSEDAWIWDEFDGTVKLGLVLRVLDKFPIQVPVKGGFMDFSVTHITITSNLPPWKMYAPEQLARHDNGKALKRRIHKIYKMRRDFSMAEKLWGNEN